MGCLFSLTGVPAVPAGAPPHPSCVRSRSAVKSPSANYAQGEACSAKQTPVWPPVDLSDAFIASLERSRQEGWDGAPAAATEGNASLATAEIKEPYYVGGLSGRNLALVEHRVFKQMRAAGLDIGTLRSGEVARRDLTEDLALRLGLSFRALAPMRNRLYMRGVAEGIDAMAKEEAAYWLGMAMHRRRPRRVLAALRCLLVE